MGMTIQLSAVCSGSNGNDSNTAGAVCGGSNGNDSRTAGSCL